MGGTVHWSPQYFFPVLGSLDHLPSQFVGRKPLGNGSKAGFLRCTGTPLWKGTTSQREITSERRERDTEHTRRCQERDGTGPTRRRGERTRFSDPLVPLSSPINTGSSGWPGKPATTNLTNRAASPPPPWYETTKHPSQSCLAETLAALSPPTTVPEPIFSLASTRSPISPKSLLACSGGRARCSWERVIRNHGLYEPEH